MSTAETAQLEPVVEAPDHLQLPETDGTIVENFAEHPQCRLLTEGLRPRLYEIHPDRQFAIGCDSGIYWRYTQPPLDGCKAPDWFYVPGVPPMLGGTFRRSYVLGREGIAPLLIGEWVSGDGSEERDRTPVRGKFWVYEQAIRAEYYVIYEVMKAAFEVYHLNDRRYQLLTPNAAGRCLIPPLQVELGIWEGTFDDMTLPWLRVWDAKTGKLVPTDSERAEAERSRGDTEQKRAETAESLLDEARQRLEEEVERAETERRRMKELAEKLRQMGVDLGPLGL